MTILMNNETESKNCLTNVHELDLIFHNGTKKQFVWQWDVQEPYSLEPEVDDVCALHIRQIHEQLGPPMYQHSKRFTLLNGVRISSSKTIPQLFTKAGVVDTLIY